MSASSSPTNFNQGSSNKNNSLDRSSPLPKCERICPFTGRSVLIKIVPPLERDWSSSSSSSSSSTITNQKLSPRPPPPLEYKLPRTDWSPKAGESREQATARVKKQYDDFYKRVAEQRQYDWHSTRWTTFKEGDVLGLKKTDAVQGQLAKYMREYYPDGIPEETVEYYASVRLSKKYGGKSPRSNGYANSSSPRSSTDSSSLSPKCYNNYHNNQNNNNANANNYAHANSNKSNSFSTLQSSMVYQHTRQRSNDKINNNNSGNQNNYNSSGSFNNYKNNGTTGQTANTSPPAFKSINFVYASSTGVGAFGHFPTLPQSSASNKHQQQHDNDGTVNGNCSGICGTVTRSATHGTGTGTAVFAGAGRGSGVVVGGAGRGTTSGTIGTVPGIGSAASADYKHSVPGRTTKSFSSAVSFSALTKISQEKSASSPQNENFHEFITELMGDYADEDNDADDPDYIPSGLDKSFNRISLGSGKQRAPASRATALAGKGRSKAKN